MLPRACLLATLGIGAESQDETTQHPNPNICVLSECYEIHPVWIYRTAFGGYIPCTRPQTFSIRPLDFATRRKYVYMIVRVVVFLSDDRLIPSLMSSPPVSIR
jgi:hypothetical protein